MNDVRNKKSITFLRRLQYFNLKDTFLPSGLSSTESGIGDFECNVLRLPTLNEIFVFLIKIDGTECDEILSSHRPYLLYALTAFWQYLLAVNCYFREISYECLMEMNVLGTPHEKLITSSELVHPSPFKKVKSGKREHTNQACNFFLCCSNI